MTKKRKIDCYKCLKNKEKYYLKVLIVNKT